MCDAQQPAQSESPLSASRLAEIEQRANAAARGPWTLDDAESWDVVVWSSEPDPRVDDPAGTELAMNLGANVVRVGSPCGTHDIANGTFIAHARQDIPDLLAEVRRLQRERETASREYRTLKLAVCLDERAVCERIRDRYFELLDDPERVDAEYQRVAVLQEFGFLPTPEGARDA